MQPLKWLNDSKRGGYWRLALCICRNRACVDMVFMQNLMQPFSAADFYDGFRTFGFGSIV